MQVNLGTGNLAGQMRQNEIKWHPLESGLLKLNTDAAIDARNQCVGLGMVIRDHSGSVIASGCQRIVVRFTPQVAEAMAIWRGKTFVKEKGLEPVVNESDDLGVVNMINSDLEVYAYIDLIIADIRHLL